MSNLYFEGLCQLIDKQSTLSVSWRIDDVENNPDARARWTICDAPGLLRPQATRGDGPLTVSDAVDATFAQRKSFRVWSWPPDTVEGVVCAASHTASSAVSAFHACALHLNLHATRIRGSQRLSYRLGYRLLCWIAGLRRSLRAKSEVKRRFLKKVARVTRKWRELDSGTLMLCFTR